MLHGDIKVNDRVIGTWEACNQGGTPGSDYVSYAVKVEYEGHDGYHYNAEYTIYHVPSHGPLTLASKVLGSAMAHVGRRNEV